MDFYCGSGSPYAWRVWLALEHKALPYELKMLSFDRGDLKTPHFTALNPRQKVPVVADRGFALYESAAIVEYLDDAYPDSGAALFPSLPRERALVRRMVREADEYLAHAMEELVEEILFTPREKWDEAAIGASRDKFAQELSRFDAMLAGDYYAGHVGAADFTIYPLIALALRMEKRKPDLAVRAGVTPKLESWMRRVEALPYFGKTIPPHWKT